MTSGAPDAPGKTAALYAPDGVLWGTVSEEVRDTPDEIYDYFVSLFLTSRMTPVGFYGGGVCSVRRQVGIGMTPLMWRPGTREAVVLVWFYFHLGVVSCKGKVQNLRGTVLSVLPKHSYLLTICKLCWVIICFDLSHGVFLYESLYFDMSHNTFWYESYYVLIWVIICFVDALTLSNLSPNLTSLVCLSGLFRAAPEASGLGVHPRVVEGIQRLRHAGRNLHLCVAGGGRKDDREACEVQLHVSARS